jgi:hypothetical protein
MILPPRIIERQSSIPATNGEEPASGVAGSIPAGRTIVVRPAPALIGSI